MSDPAAGAPTSPKKRKSLRPRRRVPSWEALAERLRGVSEDIWRPRLDEVEGVLGAPLPRMARKREVWWEKPDTPHGRALIAAGWTVDHADLDEGVIKFRRLGPQDALETADRTPAHGGRTPRVPMKAVVGGAALALLGLVAVGLSRRRRK